MVTLDQPAAPVEGAAPSPSYVVFARKYRPQVFADVVGQDTLVRILHHGLAQGRLGCSFIFSGIRGTGKTTLARLLARAFNCSRPSTPLPEPCGACPSCVAFTQECHPDSVEIDAASHTGVDDMRDVMASAPYRPLHGRFKIFIIDEVHMLSKSAFNALLKTLEEPPPHVKFIFATTEIAKVPATVLSRCLRFDLKRVVPSLLQAHLAKICDQEGVAYTPEALSLIVRASEGSVRDALSLLDQAVVLALSREKEACVVQKDVQDMLGLGDHQSLLLLFQSLVLGRIQDALAMGRQIYDKGADPCRLLEDLMQITHAICIKKTTTHFPEMVVFCAQDRNLLEELERSCSLPHIGRLWQMFLKGLEEVRASTFPLQALEMVFVRLAYVAHLPTPETLLAKMENDACPSPKTAPPSCEPLPSFSACLRWIQEKREGLLHANLVHHVRLVEFTWGTFVCALESQAPPNLLKNFKDFMEKETGIAWKVQQVHQGGEAPYHQQYLKKVELLEGCVEAHPLLKETKALFPDSTIQSIEPHFARGES